MHLQAANHRGMRVEVYGGGAMPRGRWLTGKTGAVPVGRNDWKMKDGSNQNNAGKAAHTVPEPEPDQPIAWWRPALLGAVLIAAMVTVLTQDVRAILTTIHGIVSSMGVWGPVIFLAIFVIWAALALPGSWLSAMAGVLWGTVPGFAVAMVSSTVGAGVCFLIARHVARGPIERLAQRSARFRRLDRLTREHGAIVVIVVRLIPLFPYNATNYAFGLTAIGFWTYLGWSFVCMMPGTLFLVASADALATGAMEGQVPRTLAAVSVGSLVLLGILIVVARRQLRSRELRSAMPG